MVSDEFDMMRCVIRVELLSRKQLFTLRGIEKLARLLNDYRESVQA
jgi:hypothetical protein